MLRRTVIALHRFAALYAGLLIVALGLTGSIVVFESDIDRWLNPRLLSVQPEETQIPLAMLLRIVQKAYPDDRIVEINIPWQDNISHQVNLAGGVQVYLNGHTGEILGSRVAGTSMAYKLHHYHTDLLQGEVGRVITGIGSIFLLFITVTGLFLWWQRRIVSVTWRASWARIRFDSHHLLGVCASIVFLVLTYTGILIAFSEPVPPLPAPEGTVLDEEATPITLDAAVAVADAALPDARATVIGIPAGPSSPIRISKKFPDEVSPSGRSRVYVDQFSGKVLAVEDARVASLSTRVSRLTRPIHTGAIYGWPTRALAFFAGIVIVLQTVTGFSMWWRRGG